jgi:hypothetical protein
MECGRIEGPPGDAFLRSTPQLAGIASLTASEYGRHACGTEAARRDADMAPSPFCQVVAKWQVSCDM